jgi:retron-type reverse transcriptase
MRQRGLRFGTAEEAASAAAVGQVARVLPPATTRAAPKPKRSEERVASATMEDVCERLLAAFEHVAANRGAPGPDRQRIEQVRRHLSELRPALRAALLDGSYHPGDIRRVWIPKAGGGQRG